MGVHYFITFWTKTRWDTQHKWSSEMLFSSNLKQIATWIMWPNNHGVIIKKEPVNKNIKNTK